MKLTEKLVGTIVVVLILVCAVEFNADATTPSGISFIAVGRATLPQFDVKRKDKTLVWELRLEAPRSLWMWPRRSLRFSPVDPAVGTPIPGLYSSPFAQER